MEAITLPNGGKLVYRETTEHLVGGAKRICKNCVLWGAPASGDLGSCCRLTSMDGMVLTKGRGGARTLPDFGCNEFTPRSEVTPLVLEGYLRWEYDKWMTGGADVGLVVNGVDLGDEMSEKWPKMDGGPDCGRFRFTIERLE
jgi:hypothetical protein